MAPLYAVGCRNITLVALFSKQCNNISCITFNIDKLSYFVNGHVPIYLVLQVKPCKDNINKHLTRIRQLLNVVLADFC